MNRWVGIALALMAAVVIGRHIQRFGSSESPDATARTAVDALGVQVAHADPLPPVESGAEPVREGGALGVPEVVEQTEVAPIAQAEPSEARAEPQPEPEPYRQRVPLNPEPPLPAKERRSAPRTQGPLTQIDPHQMLFEPGERAARGRVRKTPVNPTRGEKAQTQGPLSDVDPHQMLFEPGERAPQGQVRKTPVEPPSPQVQEPEVSSPDVATEPPLEPGTDAQAKARIMKRLLRVMELAGEKP